MTKFYTRQADLEPDDGELVPLTLASETPVDRGSYIEVLSHDPSHVDLTRAPLPLIVQHDTQQLNVGVVEGLHVEGRRLRGTARFGTSARAQEILRDVKAGIVRSVSIGYELLRRLGQRDGPSGVPIITFAFRPFECSAVSVPADPSAGFYRSGDFTMNDTTSTPAAAGTRSGPADRERERIEALRTVGDDFRDHGGRELAAQLVATGGSVQDLQNMLLQRVQAKAVPALGEFRALGLNDREKQSFSIVKVVNALAHPNDKRAQAAAAFEFECSEASLRTEGRSLRGGAAITIPQEVLAYARRDLLAGTGTLGGYSVGTDTLGASFVDLLKNQAHVVAAGATILGGLQGHVAIPTLATSATAYWVAENTAPTEGAMTFGQLTMSPKTLGAWVDVSRRLVIQSSIDVENFVRRELASQLSVELDRAVLNGAGTGSEPLGILASTSVGTTTGGANGAAPTWAHVVDLEYRVAANNADRGALAYFMSPKARAKLKQVTRTTDAASGFIFSDTATVNGYRSFVTNQVPDTLTKGTSTAICSAAIFGNFADAIIGQWSGIDLQVDTSSLSTVGGLRIVALTDVDVVLRRAGSFQVVKDWLC